MTVRELNELLLKLQDIKFTLQKAATKNNLSYTDQYRSHINRYNREIERLENAILETEVIVTLNKDLYEIKN